MEWLPLISATLRLIDLHDCNRAYGNHPGYSTEERTGHSDGIYLDIAFHIIHHLRLLEKRANQDYLPFDAIFAAVKIEQPNVAGVDVQFVLNVLRRPSEFFYLTGDQGQGAKLCLSEKRAIALIEKTDYADEYRLSETGRLLLSLANVVPDAAYLRGDAYNFLHAIEFNDFPKALTFSDGIISQLRVEILEIRSALERVGRTERIEKYLNHFDQYKNVIEETNLIIQRAEAHLGQSESLYSFQQEQELGEISVNFQFLLNQVNHVRQVLMVFNRLLSELLSLALQADRSAVPPPSFIDTAMHFVCTPPTPEVEQFILNQWGPMALTTPFHSVIDGLGAIKIRALSESITSMSFEDEVVEPISELGRIQFLNKYGEELATALRIGPVCLSDAIERGWFLIDNEMRIGDLVGVFVSPASLPIKGHIALRIGKKLETRSTIDGEFLFTDIEMTVLEEL